MNISPAQHTLFAKLRGLAARAPSEPRCELCAQPLLHSHRHLLECSEQRVVCACDPCSMRFQRALGGRFKLIPRRILRCTDFQMTEALWESLSLPIELAFLSWSTAQQKIIARFPSPAGATEALVPEMAWQTLLQANPVLNHLEPDVEALLINRVATQRQYFIAPIDRCHELTGLLRIHWRGFSGGEKVWEEISAFFHSLSGESETCSNTREQSIHA